MDHETLARELIRALRGRRSQTALSRRLGLQSNPVYRWEAGRAWPSAQQLFQVCRVTRVSYDAKLAAFVRGAAVSDLETEAGVATLLKTLGNAMSMQELARRTGVSRFVVSRWLSGKTDIRLPDLLRFIEVTTLRLLDFINALVDPELLPSARSAWRKLIGLRKAAYDAPWSHAILRAVELEDYRRAKRLGEGWFAKRLGISVAEERRCIELLLQNGQLERRGRRLCATSEAAVDTGVDRERRLALRTFWSKVAVERLGRGKSGTFAFNLFALSEQDLPRVQALHREFFARMQALVDASAPSERVVLYAAQMLALDASS